MLVPEPSELTLSLSCELRQACLLQTYARNDRVGQRLRSHTLQTVRVQRDMLRLHSIQFESDVV